MAKRKTPPKLTGGAVARMCKTALKEDGARYSGMWREVFDETVPFGSRPLNIERRKL